MNFVSFKKSFASIVALMAMLWAHDCYAGKTGLGSKTVSETQKKRDRDEASLSEMSSEEEDPNPIANKQGRVEDEQDLFLEEDDNLQPMDIDDEEAAQYRLETQLLAQTIRAFPSSMTPIVESAFQGEAESQNRLGIAYYKGRGVEQDFGKAVEWLQKAADQGNAEAQNRLGYAYANGKGVLRDSGKSMEWFYKAAEQGMSKSQYEVGNAYAFGVLGVLQDSKKSIEWFQKAADQGHIKSITRLANAYEHGVHVAQDFEKAVEWYQKGADLGDSYCQYNLGKAYANGNGVLRDFGMAVKWLLKARFHGAKLELGELLPLQPEAPQEEGNFQERVKKVLELINPLASYHEHKSYLNNPEGKFSDNEYAIPQLSVWYREVAEMEDEVCQLLADLLQVKPGFMVSCVKPSQRVKREMRNLKNFFLDYPLVGDEEFVTIGEENVAVARKFVAYLGGIREKFERADHNLEIIQSILSFPIGKLAALQASPTRSEEKKREFLEEQERVQKIQAVNQPNVELLAEQRTTLAKVRKKLETLIPKGAGRLNREFLEAFPFYKELR